MGGIRPVWYWFGCWSFWLSFEIQVGLTETIQTTVNPNGVYPITYTSTNPQIVTVDSTGKLTAVSKGETTVTITCGENTKTVNVKVIARVIEIETTKTIKNNPYP